MIRGSGLRPTSNLIHFVFIALLVNFSRFHDLCDEVRFIAEDRFQESGRQHRRQFTKRMAEYIIADTRNRGIKIPATICTAVVGRWIFVGTSIKSTEHGYARAPLNSRVESLLGRLGPAKGHTHIFGCDILPVRFPEVRMKRRLSM